MTKTVAASEFSPLYQGHCNELKKCVDSIRVYPIAINILKGLAALSVLAIAAAAITWVAVPLTFVVGWSLVVAAALISLVAFGALYYKINFNDLPYDFQQAFQQLLAAEGGVLTDEKLTLLERFGSVCTRLDLGNVPTIVAEATKTTRLNFGIDIAHFLSWRMTSLDDAPSNAEALQVKKDLTKRAVEEFQERYVEAKKLIPKHILMSYNTLVHLDIAIERYVDFQIEFKDKEEKLRNALKDVRQEIIRLLIAPQPDESLWGMKEIASILDRCPNLKELTHLLFFGAGVKQCLTQMNRTNVIIKDKEIVGYKRRDFDFCAVKA